MVVGVEFFVTHGRGIETLVQLELRSLSSIDVCRVCQGKIWFRPASSLPLDVVEEKTGGQPPEQWQLLSTLLLGMGSVERVFVSVLIPADAPGISSASLPQALSPQHKAQGAALLAGALSGIRADSWARTCSVWEALHASVDIPTTKTFRVAVKLRGRQATGYAAAAVAHAIEEVLLGTLGALGYERGLAYDPSALEIYVHVNDDGIIVGLPLFRARGPLSTRSYMPDSKGGALRPPVAWCMSLLAGLRGGNDANGHGDSLSDNQPQRTVVDVMAGTGITLIEAARMNASVTCVGGDLDPQQLQRFRANLDRCVASVRCRVDVVQWDVRRMVPLKPQCADVILCDLPFGLKHSTESELRRLYPAVVSQLDRISRVGTCAVLLTSDAQWPLLSRLLQGRRSDTVSMVSSRAVGAADSPAALGVWEDSVWALEQRLDLTLGKLPAVLCRLRRKAHNAAQLGMETQQQLRRRRILDVAAPSAAWAALVPRRLQLKRLRLASHSAESESAAPHRGKERKQRKLATTQQ